MTDHIVCIVFIFTFRIWKSNGIFIHYVKYATNVLEENIFG